MSKLNTSQDADPNYLASVVEITSLRKHNNADKLQVCSVFGNSCIVGLDAKVGDRCIFFPIESALSCKFLSFSNSYRHSHLNVDSSKVGFFEDKGRVKAVRLRGESSQGYLIPVESLVNWLQDEGCSVDESDFEVGTDFDMFGNISICAKYVSGPSKQAGASGEPSVKTKKLGISKRLLPNQFRFHRKTLQLGRFVELLKPDDIITITEKLHGTSAVFGKLLAHRQLPWYERLLSKLGVNIQKQGYELVYSSRNTLKNRGDGEWTKDVWGTYAAQLQDIIPNGFTIYGEIVGYQPSGKAVQKNYDYGCAPETSEFYVYRVNYTDSHGEVMEFDFQCLMDFCGKYNLKHVPLHYYGPFGTETLEALAAKYLDKPCTICKSAAVNEGVVIRIETKPERTAFKFKSAKFLEDESKSRDSGEINIEEES